MNKQIDPHALQVLRGVRIEQKKRRGPKPKVNANDETKKRFEKLLRATYSVGSLEDSFKALAARYSRANVCNRVWEKSEDGTWHTRSPTQQDTNRVLEKIRRLRNRGGNRATNNKGE